MRINKDQFAKCRSTCATSRPHGGRFSDGCIVQANATLLYSYRTTLELMEAYSSTSSTDTLKTTLLQRLIEKTPSRTGFSSSRHGVRIWKTCASHASIVHRTRHVTGLRKVHDCVATQAASRTGVAVRCRLFGGTPLRVPTRDQADVQDVRCHSCVHVSTYKRYCFSCSATVSDGTRPGYVLVMKPYANGDGAARQYVSCGHVVCGRLYVLVAISE